MVAKWLYYIILIKKCLFVTHPGIKVIIFLGGRCFLLLMSTYINFLPGMYAGVNKGSLHAACTQPCGRVALSGLEKHRQGTINNVSALRGYMGSLRAGARAGRDKRHREWSWWEEEKRKKGRAQDSPSGILTSPDCSAAAGAQPSVSREQPRESEHSHSTQSRCPAEMHTRDFPY